MASPEIRALKLTEDSEDDDKTTDGDGDNSKIILRYFNYSNEISEKEGKITCKLCGVSIKFGPGQSISNLNKHLKSKKVDHSKLLNEYRTLRNEEKS